MTGRRRTSMMEKPEFQTSPWQVLKRLAPIVADLSSPGHHRFGLGARGVEPANARAVELHVHD